MKRLIPTAAIVVTIFGLVILFMRITSRDTERDPKRSNPANRHSSAPSEQESNTRTVRNTRLSLAESLPPGAKVIQNQRTPKQIEILLADGTRIKASAASVTGTGVNFEAPYTITSLGGFAMNSEDGVYSMSRDGSFKAIGKSTASGSITMEQKPNKEEIATPNQPSD